jgi:hypothetical protein
VRLRITLDVFLELVVGTPYAFGRFIARSLP